MLNHDSASIASERANERDEFQHADVSEVTYDRKKQTLTYAGAIVSVKRQKESYLQGGFYFEFESGKQNAYTLRALKAKFKEEIDYLFG